MSELQLREKHDDTAMSKEPCLIDWTAPEVDSVEYDESWRIYKVQIHDFSPFSATPEQEEEAHKRAASPEELQSHYALKPQMSGLSGTSIAAQREFDDLALSFAPSAAPSKMHGDIPAEARDQHVVVSHPPAREWLQESYTLAAAINNYGSPRQTTPVAHVCSDCGKHFSRKSALK